MGIEEVENRLEKLEDMAGSEIAKLTLQDGTVVEVDLVEAGYAM